VGVWVGRRVGRLSGNTKGETSPYCYWLVLDKLDCGIIRFVYTRDKLLLMNYCNSLILDKLLKIVELLSLVSNIIISTMYLQRG